MICPVSSNTITDVDIVCVTAADMAAAPVPQTKQQSVLSIKLINLISSYLSSTIKERPSQCLVSRFTQFRKVSQMGLKQL